MSSFINPLLPKQNQERSNFSSLSKTGTWEGRKSETFRDIATGLDFNVANTSLNVTSIPSIWAQPLLVEMALYNTDFPGRDHIIKQWQGMLAAIAFKQARGYSITYERIDLSDDEFKNEDFVKVLLAQLPSASNALYTLPEEEHPWHTHSIVLWKGKPVGMTTPSTLIAPIPGGEWTKLPWWKDGILDQPHKHLNAPEKHGLKVWLSKLCELLSSATESDLRSEPESETGATKYEVSKTIKGARDIIIQRLDEYNNSLLIKEGDDNRRPQDPPVSGPLSSEKSHLNIGVLRALTASIEFPERQPEDSDLYLIPSESKEGVEPPLLLLDMDMDIDKKWKRDPKDIWVIGSKTLASFNENPTSLSTDVEWIKPSDLLLQELFFLDFLDDGNSALPGTLQPDGGAKLSFMGKKITPIIPLNHILLKYLDAKELIKNITFEQMQSENSKVKMTLTLKLRGGDYPLTRDYDLKEENRLTAPMLEVWPNLIDEKWKSYYAFYYYNHSKSDENNPRLFFEVGDSENKPLVIGPRDLEGSPPQVEYIKKWKLDSFPHYFICKDKDDNPLGAIFTICPKKETNTSPPTWIVGFDFGTSFTNIFIREGDSGEPQKLSFEGAKLNLTVAKLYDESTRFNVLNEQFIFRDLYQDKSLGEQFDLELLPCPSVLTTRDASKGLEERNNFLPVMDGRIYIPPIQKAYEPQKYWIHTGLKWDKEQRDYSRIFIQHLSLEISALAIKKGVKTVKWAISYPSAFDEDKLTGFEEDWKECIAFLKDETGVNHTLKEWDANQSLAESLAAGCFFKENSQNQSLVNAICIDIGGGTSDISIWHKNTIIYQCSVKLAGRDLVNYKLEKSRELVLKLLPKMFGSLKPGSDWEETWQDGELKVKGEAFNSKLDRTLQTAPKSWLSKAHLIEDGEFDELLRLILVGFSGLHYYVGTILKNLQHNKDTDIIIVYLGGNGSRFLSWLGLRGKSGRDHAKDRYSVLEEMVRKGADFSDLNVDIELSEAPKDEVAKGLVSSIKLELSQIAKQKQAEWEKNKKRTLDNTDIQSTLKKVFDFFSEFNKACHELGCTKPKPFPEGLADDPDLRREVFKELDKIWEDKQPDGERISDGERIYEGTPFVWGLKALLYTLAKSSSRFLKQNNRTVQNADLRSVDDMQNDSDYTQDAQ